MTKIDLRAPLDGVIPLLGQVPDPVFSQKMVGDRISIDPSNPAFLCSATQTVAGPRQINKRNPQFLAVWRLAAGSAKIGMYRAWYGSDCCRLLGQVGGG